MNICILKAKSVQPKLVWHNGKNRGEWPSAARFN